MSDSFLCAMPCEPCERLLECWFKSSVFLAFYEEQVALLRQEKWPMTREAIDRRIGLRLMDPAFQRENIVALLDMAMPTPFHVKLRMLRQYPQYASHKKLLYAEHLLNYDLQVGGVDAAIEEISSCTAQDLVEILLSDNCRLRPPGAGVSSATVESAWRQALTYVATLPDYLHLAELWRNCHWLRHVLRQNPATALEQLAWPEKYPDY